MTQVKNFRVACDGCVGIFYEGDAMWIHQEERLCLYCTLKRKIPETTPKVRFSIKDYGCFQRPEH